MDINIKLNGRYEVAEELGRGGFGVAYLAHDAHMLSRPVVVKTPRAATGETPDYAWFRKKFDQEIMALARIEHPCVVRIYEYGWTPEGEPFFVMPFIEGDGLDRAIGDGGMELKRAARIVSQLGSALSAAHDVGVIHRDVKPQNVMLQNIGGGEFAILIDFGIATVEDLDGARRGQKTRVAGTTPYMAPEQLRGSPLPASDVWALGVVAYEAVTGRLPFPTDDIIELGDMQRAGVDVMPRALRPELPEAAQAVILRALSYDPAGRHPHAHEMGEAFLRAVTGGAAALTTVSAGATEYPSALDGQTAPPAPQPPEALLRRCRELFKEFDEFQSPDSLRPLFRTDELSVYEDCVKRAAGLDFNQLLDCLFRSGREYRGQALIDLLALLASRYRKDYRGQACEGLRSELRQRFAQARR